MFTFLDDIEEVSKYIVELCYTVEMALPKRGNEGSRHTAE